MLIYMNARKKIEKFRLSRFVDIEFESPIDFNYFFGYYYNSPLSKCACFLLAHKSTFDSRDLNENDFVEVGYFDLRNNNWIALGLTKAFNWQQGAMLQWLGPDFNTKIIYNIEGEHTFNSLVVNIVTGERKKINRAIYDVHPSGNFALGVQFERHFYTRAYHYMGIKNKYWDEPLHSEDGIWRVDLINNTSSLILKTSDLAKLDLNISSNDDYHWLEHIKWNPSGSRFYFLHRYGKGNFFKTKICTCDINGHSLFCVDESNNLSLTHAGWKSDKFFVNYFTKSKSIALNYSKIVNNPKFYKSFLLYIFRLVKKLLPENFVDRKRSESGYFIIEDQIKIKETISEGLLRRDGHPSWTKNGRYMLTDTYSDVDGFRHLLLYNYENKKVFKLASFFSPYNESIFRCDLHPRFSYDDQKIIIDSAHTGIRQILVLNVNWNYINSSIDKQI